MTGPLLVLVLLITPNQGLTFVLILRSARAPPTPVNPNRPTTPRPPRWPSDCRHTFCETRCAETQLERERREFEESMWLEPGKDHLE